MMPISMSNPSQSSGTTGADTLERSIARRRWQVAHDQARRQHWSRQLSRLAAHLRERLHRSERGSSRPLAPAYSMFDATVWRRRPNR